MEIRPTCDAVVGFEDAVAWARQLLKESPGSVISRALNLEPFVVGTAAKLAERVEKRLLEAGVAEQVIEAVADQVVLAAAIAVEMMRRGHLKLWDDVDGENKHE